MSRLLSVTPVFVRTVPEELEHGKLYISEEYGVAVHLCACGCGGKTVMPFKPHWQDGWELTRAENDVVTFTPSIGNFSYPCRSHYYIRKNQVEWCE